MKPVLFYTIGYPGAGKTTIARGLASVLGAAHIRGDAIGLELFRFPTFSAEERQIVYAEMGKRAGQALRANKHAVYDATTNTVAQRAQIVALAQAYGGKAIGVWVQTPAPLAKRRAGTARDRGIAGNVARIVPPQLFDRYVMAFEAPRQGEVILRISGNAPFYLQYRRLARQLQRHSIHIARLI